MTRAQLMDNLVAEFFSDDDCLTAQEWDVLWDNLDSNGMEVVIQEV